jgi:hypothetical protein
MRRINANEKTVTIEHVTLSAPARPFLNGLAHRLFFCYTALTG